MDATAGAANVWGPCSCYRYPIYRRWSWLRVGWVRSAYSSLVSESALNRITLFQGASKCSFVQTCRHTRVTARIHRLRGYCRPPVEVIAGEKACTSCHASSASLPHCAFSSGPLGRNDLSATESKPKARRRYTHHRELVSKGHDLVRRPVTERSIRGNVSVPTLASWLRSGTLGRPG